MQIQNSSSTLEEALAVSYKFKKKENLPKTIIRPTNSSSEYLSNRNKSKCPIKELSLATLSLITKTQNNTNGHQYENGL